MLKNLNWETKFTFTSTIYKYLLEISPILSCIPSLFKKNIYY